MPEKNTNNMAGIALLIALWGADNIFNYLFDIPWRSLPESLWFLLPTISIICSLISIVQLIKILPHSGIYYDLAAIIISALAMIEYFIVRVLPFSPFS